MKSVFADLLSELISKSEISKNEMIRDCDIDRSSFYKFLSGSRIPTEEQFNRICDKMSFSPLEEKKLRTEYARLTKGEKTVLTQRKITDFLWKIEDMENEEAQEGFSDIPLSFDDRTVISGKPNVIGAVISTILLEMEKGSGSAEVNLFLPPGEEEVSEQILKLLSGSSGKRIRFRHLIELPSRQIEERQMIVDRLRYAMLCTLADPSSYCAYYYYANTSILASIGVFYAFSLITEHKVILINARMNKAIVITDAQCCEDYGNHFMTALNSAKPLLKKVKRNELSAELEKPILYCYGSREELDRFAKDSMASFVSIAWIKRIMEKGFLQETEQNVVGAGNGKLRLLCTIRSMLGSKIFIVDERNIPPARAWCAALSGSDKLIIYVAGSDYYFIATEPNLVQIFYSFMEQLPKSGNLLRNDLALEIIDSMIDSAKG